MNAQQWQEKVDGYFPDGVNVLWVDDVPQGMEDNIVLMCPRLLVLSVVNDLPTFWTWPVNDAWQNKDILIATQEILEDRKGYIDLITIDGQRYVLTDNVPPAAKEWVDTTRGTAPDTWSYQPTAEESAAA